MSSVAHSDPDHRAIPTRVLCIDPVQQANSGQPGIAKARLAASAGG
jgi:hypothetical protein